MHRNLSRGRFGREAHRPMTASADGPSRVESVIQFTPHDPQLHTDTQHSQTHDQSSTLPSLSSYCTPSIAYTLVSSVLCGCITTRTRTDTSLFPAPHTALIVAAHSFNWIGYQACSGSEHRILIASQPLFDRFFCNKATLLLSPSPIFSPK